MQTISYSPILATAAPQFPTAQSAIKMEAQILVSNARQIIICFSTNALPALK